MQAADAFWHLTNFFAPAVVLGAFAAALAKLFWRRELGGAGVFRLWAWASTGAAAVSVAGLAWFGQDGRIATYAAMVLTCAAAIWWAGFRRATPR